VPEVYSYNASVKSGVSDEPVNTYLMRPLAGLLVRVLYSTPVTPNMVTLAAALFGFVAAGLYASGDPVLTGVAGLTLTGKDVLDSADGQLARAKAQFSRAGRFLDSIGDIAVNFSVFAGIAWAGLGRGEGIGTVVLCCAAFLCMSLRVPEGRVHRKQDLRGVPG
jgi:phosphatidylglycerophosphate synthase